MIKRVLLAVIISAFVAPVFVSAQFDMGSFFNPASDLDVEINPTYPTPDSLVSINLSLYTGDLNSAQIIWYKDGKEVLRGRGETRYSFVAGGAGEETDIEIAITLLNGINFSKSFTLNPAGIDLVWETNSYVPPFYRGKALYTKQGDLKIVAMPNFVKGGRQISPKNLVYEWSNGINVYQSQSGYGRNAISIQGSILGGTENISVLVTDPINNLVARAFLYIKPTNPEIVFYQNDPYYGYLFDSALSGAFDLKSNEVQILAAPFYFTRESGDFLDYKWRLNSQSVADLSGSRTAIFKKPEGEAGQSVIALQMENLNRILQQADQKLIINYDK